jgi:hypothetical protein
MDAFIVTPFGRFGGALAGVQSRHQSYSIDKFIGCANRAGEDNRQFSEIGGRI